MLERRFSAITKYISRLDSAINDKHEEFDFDKYKETGDVKFLCLKEGSVPTVFELAPLTRKQVARIVGLENSMDQFSEVVACGLRSVKDFVVDGEPVVLEHHEPNGERRLKPASLDRIFDPTLFADLSTRILELNRLGPTKG